MNNQRGVRVPLFRSALFVILPCGWQSFIDNIYCFCTAVSAKKLHCSFSNSCSGSHVRALAVTTWPRRTDSQSIPYALSHCAPLLLIILIGSMYYRARTLHVTAYVTSHNSKFLSFNFYHLMEHCALIEVLVLVQLKFYTEWMITAWQQTLLICAYKWLHELHMARFKRLNVM